MNPTPSVDYSQITESPGLLATEEQLQRLYQRYRFASQFIRGGNVLEVACGTGIGLGYLALNADRVYGVDIDKNNLAVARVRYETNEKVIVQEMDAHDIAFSGLQFNVVLLYEAVYYLRNPVACFSRIRGALREDGVFVLCTVNREWADFHPSPYTHRYYSVRELHAVLKPFFRTTEFYGAFPVKTAGVKTRIYSLIKRLAVTFDLIPGSLKMRAYLKRMFIGKLVALPPEVYNGMSEYHAPVAIPADVRCSEYTILYAVARP